MVLSDRASGTELAIEQDSPQGELALLLMEANPESKDPQEAQEAEILIAYAEARIWEVTETQQDQVQTLLDTAFTEKTAQVVDIEALHEVLETEGDKVLIAGLLVDRETAQALLMHQLVQARAVEAGARLMMYLADPAYAAAASSVEETINHAPGVVEEGYWSASAYGRPEEEPDYLEMLNEGHALAITAREQAEQGVLALEKASQFELPSRLDICVVGEDNDQLIDSKLSSSKREASYAMAYAGRARIDAQASRYSAEADRVLAEYDVHFLEWEIAATEPQSGEYSANKKAHDEGQVRLGRAEANESVAKAWYDVAKANVVVQERRAEAEDVKAGIIGQYQETLRPRLFEADGFDRRPDPFNSKPTGELLNQVVEERDGQLFLINDYAKIDEPYEVQLTFDPDDVPSGVSRTAEQQQIDEIWVEGTEDLKTSLLARGQAMEALSASAQTQAEREQAESEKHAEKEEQILAEMLAEHEGTIVPDGSGEPELLSIGAIHQEDLTFTELDGHWVHPTVAIKYQTLIETDESPRVPRRLHYLREWSHDQIKQVFPRGSRACGATGARASGRVSIALGGR